MGGGLRAPRMVVRVPLNAHVLTELNVNSRIVGKPHLYSPEFESDIVLIEPQPRHRTPSAWIILCTLGGSITLHWVAELYSAPDFVSSDWKKLSK
jgi:hypothetical protein